MLFAILLAALGIAQAQMSFPDITQAAVAIERVFGTIDRKPSITLNEGGEGPWFALAGCALDLCTHRLSARAKQRQSSCFVAQ